MRERILALRVLAALDTFAGTSAGSALVTV